MIRRIIWNALAPVLFSLTFGCSKDAPREPDPVPSSSAENIPTRTHSVISGVIPAATSQINLRISLPPERLQSVLQNPNRKPPPQLLLSLKEEDRQLLMARYREETELTNKLSLTIALAFVGNEETVTAFENTLLHLSRDRVLNSDEQSVLLFTVEGLGFLAREYDSAFQFLVNATDPWFWKQNTKWIAENGNHQFRTFAGRSIGSLGYSQRAEADAVFNRVKEQPFVDDLQGGGWLLDSALLDGVFFRDLLQHRGLEGLKALYGTEELLSEYRIWTKTENGKQWRAWSHQWRQNHPREAGFLPPPQ